MLRVSTSLGVITSRSSHGAAKHGSLLFMAEWYFTLCVRIYCTHVYVHTRMCTHVHARAHTCIYAHVCGTCACTRTTRPSSSTPPSVDISLSHILAAVHSAVAVMGCTDPPESRVLSYQKASPHLVSGTCRLFHSGCIRFIPTNRVGGTITHVFLKQWLSLQIFYTY